MSKGKQSVKKGVWYTGSKIKEKKKGQKGQKGQKGKGIPFGLIASLAAPVLGEVAKPILNKTFGKGTTRCKKIKK